MLFRSDLDVASLRRDLRACVASTRVDRAVVTGRLAELRHREEETIGRELLSARRRPDVEALHSARRSARRLRYAAEIVDLLDGTRSDAADRWRKMQTRLGEIQDRHVLGAWLEGRERRANARGDAALATAASRALGRVKRDAAGRIREFLATEAGAAPNPPV